MAERLGDRSGAEARARVDVSPQAGAPSPRESLQPATTSEVEDAVRRLGASRAAIRARPVREIASSLGRAGARFLDAADPLRKRVLAGLPAAAGLSPAMAREVLDGMARDWTEDRLLALLEAELPDPTCLDDLTTLDGPAGGRELMAVGPSLCLQIVSGSVPGVGVNALLRSLLVKAPTLLKPGRGDVLLPTLFAEALAHEDPELARALEVVYWAGGSEAVERAALDAAEVTVVYGSDETVAALRARAPATTRVVGYHHRVGVGVVGREVLGGDVTGADDAAKGDESPDASRAAAAVARSVALFEQRGCVCPQVVWVEEGGRIGPADFARLVARALADLETELPAPPSGPEEGGATAQLRGTAEMYAASGELEIHHGGSDAVWTVIFESGSVAGLPGAGRTVRVRPLADVAELASALEPLGPHLQSVGHAGLGARCEDVAEAVGRVGASRLVPFGALSFPPPWWLHDGQGPLRVLVRWVELERG